MRFYSVDECITLSRYFNDTFLKYEDYKNIVLGSPIVSKDFVKRRTMNFQEYKEKYKLNCVDYYDVYKQLYSEGKSLRPDELIIDKGDRYPIIILCNYHDDKGYDIPEMIHFTELPYTMEHFDDSELRVIVIDKMKKPIQKRLLNRYAKYYNIQSYDYELYQ